MLEQNTVKIENKAYDEETFDPDVTLEYEEMGNGEPSKRPRWDTLGSQYSDDEAERAEDEEYLTNVIDVKFPSDTYMPEGIDNIHNKSCNSIHAQVLAQTIVNAFLQAKRKTQLKNSFIPSFLVSDTYITIHMYNPGFDVLLTHSSVLSIFKNTFHSDTLELNTDAILSIWLALNMHKFSKQLPMEQGDALTALHVQRSQFQSLMGPAILEIYENKLVAPLPRKDKPIKIRKYYNCEKTTDYVRECLARMFEEVPHSEMETLDKTVSILDS